MKNMLFTKKLVLALLLLAAFSGCASSMMIRSETKLEPGPDYAIVNFIRPSVFGGAIKFGIWDSDNLIGVLTPKNYIQYKAQPGDHIFLARAENWAVIKATVVAGKTYYIVGEPRMGAFKARVALTVADPADPKIQKWIESLTPITVDPSQKEAYVKTRVEDVRKAVKNVENGTASYEIMKPDDGR